MSHKNYRSSVLGILLISLLFVLPGVGQVVADQSAPGNNRPTVLLTSNGINQVNITTPTTQGVSVNYYSQFDVQSNGLILNNSRRNVFTQLGGTIAGNPWLATGSARVIINQINSNNPSFLGGIIEIAGRRADLIIANPSGISVSGGGFINVRGLTLTTGIPLINAGALTGFSVNQGLITISGDGLNATGTRYADIFARALTVNGIITASKLNVITGANEITDGEVTSSGTGVGTAPQFAIDSSLLGGMYANKITLIGTENGLGFNNTGEIQTNDGNITIDVNGNLTNSGTIGSAKRLKITSAETDNSSGRMFAETVRIDTVGNRFFNNNGEITAFDRLVIKSGEFNNDAGTILSVGDLTIRTNGQKLINTNNGPFSGILGGGLIKLRTGEIDNSSGNIASTSIDIKTFGNLINNDTGNISGDIVTLNSGEISNNFGTILAVQDLGINTNGASLINVNSGFDRGIISGGILNVQTGFLNNLFGSLYGVTVDINTAGNIFNNDGGFVAGDAITINSGELSNNFATILSAGDLTIDTNGERLINVNSFDDKGIFSVNSTLLTGELINGTGNIISSANLNINTSGNIFRNDGGFVAAGDVDINSGELDNAVGTIVSYASLLIDTNGEKLTNTGSENEIGAGITSGTAMTLRAGVLDNTSGRIVSDGTASIDTFLSRPDGTSESNEIDNSFGLIKGLGLTINSGKLTNHLGQISSTDFLNINTNAQDLINNGTGEGLGIIGVRGMQLRTGFLDNSGGRLVALNIDIDTNGDKVNNDAGFITALSNLTVNSGEFTNRTEGTVQAYGDLAINTNGRSLINTDSGEIRGIISFNALTLQTGQIENINGRIVSDILNIETGTAEIRNGFGLIRGNDTVTINSGALENDAGTILSKNNLVINTQGRVIVNAGLIQSEDGDLTINTNGNDFLNFNSGESRGILSKGNLSLTTGRFENVTARIVSEGNIEINTNLQEMRNFLSGLGLGYGILSKGTIDLQTGKLDNNTGTIESLGDLTINTNGRELFNFNSGILNNPDGTTGVGGKGISSGGLIFLNTGTLNNSTGTIQGNLSININTNGQTLINQNSTPRGNLPFPVGGQGIVARQHIGIFGALDNTNGLLMSQTFSIFSNEVISAPGTVIDPFFDGKLTLTGISHLVEGPTNPFQDPFDKQNWVLNGISNSVSDFLGFDSLAESTFVAANPQFPLGDRFVAGGVAILTSADLLTGGLGAGKAVRFGGQRILAKAPRIQRAGARIVGSDAFQGVKQGIKNRINPKNYEVVFDDTVHGSIGSGLKINYKGSGKWFDNIPAQLKTDIDDIGSDLGVLFDSATDAGRADLFSAWDIVKNRNVQIRANAPSLEALSKVLNNPNRNALGLTDEVLGNIKGSQNLAYRDVVKTLDEFGLNIQGKNINISDFDKVLSDLVKGDGFTEGAEWTLQYVSRKADEFAGKSLRFEVFEKWDDLSETFIRKIDLIDETNSNAKILYEFKSVKNVPPGKFSEQFIKDLSNPEVTDLDQIRWLFDGRKAPPDFAANMRDAVNNLTLTDELARKLLQDPQATATNLRAEILALFNDIFVLVK